MAVGGASAGGWDDRIARVAAELPDPPPAGDDRRAEAVRGMLRRLGEAGLILPEAGGALTRRAIHARVAAALERVDSGYRLGFSVQASLAGHTIETQGAEAPHRRLLMRVASGEAVAGACFVLAAADGPDASQSRPCLRRDAGRWVLCGRAGVVTNAPVADVFVIWCPDESGRLAALAIARNRAGIVVGPADGAVSPRGAAAGSVAFDRVPIEPGDVMAAHRSRRPALAGLMRHWHDTASGVLALAADIVARLPDAIAAAERRDLAAKLGALRDEVADLILPIEHGAVHPGVVKSALHRSVAIAERAARLGQSGLDYSFSDWIGRHAANVAAVRSYLETSRPS